ncbi:MAG: M20/M25/M40 family metallo-hydrolase [Candidatus Latescibacteria bacterium]|jgi:acetylornithine deacetylase/succinyl-diaminopimelate desuccinylase-like protein|nr:M20/M25/M40 family metallo-hydrolase [Candidatus Latescibacterota bacterium]|tara:strand:- start:101 stop:1288 length:1188 start_codon:yes stop_codon:yes gene_type:complete
MDKGLVERVQQAVDEKRLIDTAVQLIEVPSPTRSAGAVADRLAEILGEDGFSVERPVADWPEAPAVAVRFDSGAPGRVLQFDGHLDTVHLPFVPPRLEKGCLYGSGSSDMKGGIAAFVEALRVLRETETLQGGQILITAHDHHEGPWGDRRQLVALIREGYVGDAVLLPEYLADCLPVAGRGMAIFEVRITRDGEPVHEVLRPADTPDVLAAGAQLVVECRQWSQQLALTTHEVAGCDSVFVGRLQSGEIYNQSPTECVLNGTRRWVTPGAVEEARSEFAAMLQDLADRTGTQIEHDFEVQGDAFRIDLKDPLVGAFRSAYESCTGEQLSPGRKSFVDDGNSFARLAGIPALTHGPAATGAHTLSEEVSVAELIRVAQVYALTAITYCPDAAEAA